MMPKNYKTYTAPGGFSEFQIRVPDQTAKIERQTKRQVQGLDRARQFQKENEELYLRAQRLVNSAEDASRETNFRMQSLERQSYKDALDRDYKIQMANLDAENKTNQTNLQNLSAFSKTAFEMVGNYMQQQEEAKVAAAHDVISRTGVTYDQMVAFQKMDDNLTRAEFAAQDSLQELLGPDADPRLIDGMFAVYQNRNTKRWIEHKQLFQNTLNAFPDFMEMRLNEIRQETGQVITDIDSTLAKIKREFIEVNFVGNARPEVLAGAKVYAKLDQLVNKRRDLLLNDRRNLQKKEFEQDRQNAFAVAYNQDGVPGLIRWNSTDPSYQKRQDLKNYLTKMSKVTGAFAFDDQLIDDILDYPGGGSNGQTLRKSFPLFAVELEDIQKQILDEEEKDFKRQERTLEREFEDEFRDAINQRGADGELTAEEVKAEYNRLTLLPKYYGVSTDVVNDAMRYTSDAQKWRQTKEYLNFLASKNLLTREAVSAGLFDISKPNEKRFYENLATKQEQLNQDPKTKEHLSRIEASVTGHPEVLASVAVYKNLNEINHTLAVNDFKQRYRSKVAQLAANEGYTLDKARDDAFSAISAEILQTFKDKSKWNGDAFTDFMAANPNQQQLQRIEDAQKTGIAQQNQIRDALYEYRLDPDKAYTQVAKLINHAEVEKAVTTFGQKYWSMPPIIRYIGEVTDQNALQVLKKIAPYIPNKELQLKLDALSKEQEKNYKQFNITPFSPIRNTFRTAERTGRANTGDTKTGASKPLRPAFFKVVQYVSGDPAIKGKTNGRIIYDNGSGPRGHGGDNYHNHYEFATQDQAAAAKAIFELNGYRVTSYLRPNDTGSAHSRGVALDIAPPFDLPRTEEAEAEWSARANALIGFDPLENE